MSNKRTQRETQEGNYYKVVLVYGHLSVDLPISRAVSPICTDMYSVFGTLRPTRRTLHACQRCYPALYLIILRDSENVFIKITYNF